MAFIAIIGSGRCHSYLKGRNFREKKFFAEFNFVIHSFKIANFAEFNFANELISKVSRNLISRFRNFKSIFCRENIFHL